MGALVVTQKVSREPVLYGGEGVRGDLVSEFSLHKGQGQGNTRTR